MSVISLTARLEKLEKEAAPYPPAGMRSLQIDVMDDEKCNVALQRELDRQGITLNDVRYLSIICGIHARPMRDLQNHPDRGLLKKLGDSGRIWEILIVGSKEDWEEYLEYKRTSQDITSNVG